MRGHFVLEKLKRQGHRITKTRRQILQILGGRKPMSASELLDGLEALGNKVNKTTVYRELWFLKEGGFLQEVSFGEGRSRFELVSENCHHHLVCESCGDIEDIVLDEKLIMSQIKGNFELRRHSIEFFGLCISCQKS